MTADSLSLRVAVLARSVYPLHGYGGLERHVYDLVRCLLARGVEVTLITRPPLRRAPADVSAQAVLEHPRLTLAHVPYWTFPLAGRRGTTVLDRSTAYLWFGWRAGRVAARLSERGAIDIVHSLGASALGYALLPSGSPRRKAWFVLNPQGLEEFGATDPGRARLKRLGYWPLRTAGIRCARAADRVIATDNSLLQPVVTHLGIPAQKISIIPNAVELADCDRPDAHVRALELRARIGLEPGDVLLVSVGRLEANKGFGVLLRALRALLASGGPQVPRIRWVLVGEGPMRRRLAQDISALGLEREAVLWGRADAAELHAWYEAATLFVHPTLYEGSSLVTLEAMAHRRAVVATTAGGLPDKVRPSVNGWLVAPGDAQALAAAIGDALSNPPRLASMGAAGRAIVEREFSWTVVIDRLLTVYAELIAPSRLHRPPVAAG
jgi:glycosyltransferase involved in cell wall biosynthesis